MLKCKFCGVEGRKDGRPFEKQGQLNLHEYHCKMKNVPHETIEEECKHNWRLLSVNSPIENTAYNNGYMEVCRTCQELR